MKAGIYGLVAGLAIVLAPVPLAANDSDASVAVGGVVLMREPRISMESERLTISLSKVTVDYEFLNESDQDITTEVAFPIPPYQFTESAGGIRAFDDFRLWVDGKELPYQVEAKAYLRTGDDRWKMTGEAKDVTAILKKYAIDVPTLGHYFVNGKESDGVPDFERLPLALRKRVSDLGLIGVEQGSIPLWEVRKTYYWRQTFRAHQVLRVRHEYSPGFGFEGIDASTFSDLSNSKSAIKNDRVAAADRWEYWNDQPRLLRDSCVEPSTQKSIFSRANGVGYVDTSWVDYILTTANSWKTPIKRFELIVERGPKRDLGYYDDWDYASFCWDGPVKKVGPYRYEASATHFVPKRELKVLFLAIPVASTTSAAEVSHSSVGGLLRSRWVWVGMVLVVVVLAGVGWGWVRTRPKFGNPSTRLE